MKEQIDAVLGEVKGWWRYRFIAIAAAWVVCLMGWLVVYSIPDSYQSSARLYIDSSSVLRPILDSMTVSTNIRTRVEMVTTIMLGRPELEKVARETDMHLRASGSEGFSKIVTEMRSKIRISNNSRSDPDLYTISYSDVEPDVARNVVSTLLNNFVEDVLGGNREDAAKAQTFLREQLQKLDTELVAAEKRLADFKRENVGRMPGSSGNYFERLQARIEALEATETELRVAERRKTALEQRLAGEASVIPGAQLESDIDRRITENEKRLAELRLRFTELHPDIVALRETLEDLTAQKLAEVEALSNMNGTAIASDNPVFQNIQIELNNVNVELATLSERAADQRREISELRALIDVLPQIEAELKRLNRDYDVKQSQYQALLNRLEVAELSESADQSEDVKFRIIEPPILPDEPSAPNRPLLIAAVLLGGFGVGGAIAFLLNQINPIFSTPTSLRQYTGLPVLGTIQIMRTAERKRWRRSQLAAVSASIATLVVVFGIVLIEHKAGTAIVQDLVWSRLS